MCQDLDHIFLTLEIINLQTLLPLKEYSHFFIKFTNLEQTRTTLAHKKTGLKPALYN
jgi:type IV secretory pathway component VirB8